MIVETNLDIRDALVLHYAYSLNKNLFSKIFLIISIYSNIKKIDDLFYKDIEHVDIKHILNDMKKNCNNSEHILLLHLYNYIFENNDSGLFNMFLIRKILKDYKSQLYKILPIFKTYNIQMDDIKSNNTDNENIIDCFNYGYSSRIAHKHDDHYIFNGLKCTVNETIFNTKKVKKIIFCKNLYLNGKFYISILTSPNI